METICVYLFMHVRVCVCLSSTLKDLINWYFCLSALNVVNCPRVYCQWFCMLPEDRGQRLTSLTKPDPLQNGLHLQWWNPEAGNNDDSWTFDVATPELPILILQGAWERFTMPWLLSNCFCTMQCADKDLGLIWYTAALRRYLLPVLVNGLFLWPENNSVKKKKQCVSESLLTSVRGDGAGSGETIGGSKDYTEDSKLLTANIW